MTLTNVRIRIKWINPSLTHAKIIADLRQENKELHLQVRNIQDLKKDVTSSHESREERHTVLKAQARNLKFKSHVSSAKLNASVDGASPYS